MAVDRGCGVDVGVGPVREFSHIGSASRCLYFTSFFTRTDLGARTTLKAIGNMGGAG